MQPSIDLMVQHITEVLHANRPSIYLYGSVALGDFRLGWSDIDILVVTEKPLSSGQAESLLGLRQRLQVAFPQNPYFRLCEGGILSLQALIAGRRDTVVYWGTSGQQVADQYQLGPFAQMELIDHGRLLHGREIRSDLSYPSRQAQLDAIRHELLAVRKHAQVTDSSLYSAGWLLTILRCLFTLRTGRVIAKTLAGVWALENRLSPDPDALRRVLAIREHPDQHADDVATLAWLASLGPCIQQHADLLETELLAAECSVG